MEFAADAVAIAEAWASGDRAAVQHAVSGALIDATSIAGTPEQCYVRIGIPGVGTGFADPQPVRPRPRLRRPLRGRHRRLCTDGYCAMKPPSITSSVPVTNEASSDARNSTP